MPQKTPHRVFNPLTVLSALILILLSMKATAQSAPDRAAITAVHLRGTGCDQAEVAAALSPDFKDISLLFDNYVVEIGQGSSQPHRLDLIKDCQITLVLDVPAGWQMAFRAVDYRGFVVLSSQGTAFHRFSIQQEGAPIVSMREAALRGPMNDDYYVRSEVRPERLTWSRCLQGTTHVNLISQLGVRLNPRSSDRSLTQITLDSADGSLRQNLMVEWRRCAGGRPGRDSREGDTIVRPPRDSRPPRYGGR